MEKLEVLESITRISDKVIRILGQNPSKFTLQGTNTYLIGTSNPYILLDVGEGKVEYPPLLRTALENPRNPSLPDISDIILTHWHPTMFGVALSAQPLSRSLGQTKPGNAFLTPSPSIWLKKGDYLPAPGGSPVHDLVDDQNLTAFILPPGSNPDDWTLQVLYCPGHTADSVSLLFPADRALFTGDAVLGQGTAVFEDLSDYIASLQKKYDARDKYDTLYPSHGPVVRDGAKMIRGYIDHRLERESQVLKVLGTTPPEGLWTTWTVTLKVYEGYPESLLEPAAGGIIQHLNKLGKEGKVRGLGGELKEARWELVH
ncbi:beta-lactamase-like protein [Lactarius quietus]|nr:beta-lactamase-like protein [Lactarius quietus]